MDIGFGLSGKAKCSYHFWWQRIQEKKKIRRISYGSATVMFQLNDGILKDSEYPNKKFSEVVPTTWMMKYVWDKTNRV